MHPIERFSHTHTHTHLNYTMLANIDQVEISFLCGKNSKLTFVHLVEYHTSAFLILWKKVVTVSCMTNGV